MAQPEEQADAQPEEQADAWTRNTRDEDNQYLLQQGLAPALHAVVTRVLKEKPANPLAAMGQWLLEVQARAAAHEPEPSETADATISHFKPFDEPLADALAAGALRLLDAAALRAGVLPELARRQDLEERERVGGPTLFLPPADAAAALRAADRRVCFVTHGWRSCVHPDPDGATLAALLRFLHHPLGEHVVGVFFDFACLHQSPRTKEQDTAFGAALNVMANGYASPLGTTVARFAVVPPTPADLVATVAVFAAGAMHLLSEDSCASCDSCDVCPIVGVRYRKLPASEDFDLCAACFDALPAADKGRYEQLMPEAAVRAALGDGGRKVAALEFIADKRVWRAELGSAVEAQAAVEMVEALRPDTLGEGARAFRWYNDRPYAETKDADGTVTPGRGWCTLESGASEEMVARVAFFPKMVAKLASWPAKLVEIGDGAPRVVEPEASATGGRPRIQRIRAALGDHSRTQFTGRGDRDVVVRMFNSFVVDVGSTVTRAIVGLGGVDFSRVKYEGELNAAGRPEGRGTARYPTGDQYAGEWKAGDKAGGGVYTFTSGEVFEGEFKGNAQEGRGTLTYFNGCVEVGCYRAGESVGEGVQWGPDRQSASRMLDGKPQDEISLDEARAIAARIGLPVPPIPDSLYVGERNAAGEPEGRGKFTPPSGENYDGEWRAGMRQGWGAQTYLSGDVYEGEFSANAREGRGTYTMVTGKASVGRYLAGNQVGEGVLWTPSRQTAGRLLDGKLQAEISLDEARELAARIGLPVPPPIAPKI